MAKMKTAQKIRLMIGNPNDEGSRVNVLTTPKAIRTGLGTSPEFNDACRRALVSLEAYYATQKRDPGLCATGTVGVFGDYAIQIDALFY